VISVVIALAFSRIVDGDEIFARAREVWTTQRVPAYLEYTVTTAVARNGQSTANHYAAACYCEKNQLLVDKVSDEQNAHPPTPHGTTLSFGFTLGWNNGTGGGRETVSKTVNPPQLPDPVGVPLLSPLYSFGMELAAAATKEQTATSLPVIATTSTAARHYAVTIAGDEEIDGRSAYHLLLQPLSQPHTYRLRDIWIDESTFETLQARVGANFTDDWFNDRPWSIHFSNDLGFEHVAYEESDGPVTLHGHTFDSVRISFDNLHATTTPSKTFWIQTPVYDPLSEP
jgi:hypothetical protein